MPKWEIKVERQSEQTHGGKTRTVGTYQVYHDGQKATGTIRIGDKDVPLSGTTAEAAGPSQNAKRANEGFPTRIVAKTYPMQVSGGPTYVTNGYRQDETIAAAMPGLELKDTDRRTDILIHPGKDEFRSSVGCINLCTHLKTPDEIISYAGSRRRVIALIEDMKAVLGVLPGPDQPIPNAFVVIGEDALTQPDALAANATRTGNEAPASAAGTPEGIGWPLRRNVIRGNVRNHTFGKVRNGGTKPHQGWDMLAPIGTECLAIADGKIHDVYESGAYGHVIELSFGFKNQKLFAAYAHLSAVKVKKGDPVNQGQLIGLTGDSGNAANLNRSEMHLHFEVRTRSRPGLGLDGRIDPTNVFGTCPLKDAIIWSPDGETAPPPQTSPAASPVPAPKPAASNAKPPAMDRTPVFDAVRTLLGRGFTDGEVEALDDACDLALASVPFDRRPLFDAVRIMLERGFSVAEVNALDAAFDAALASDKPAPASSDKPDATPVAGARRRLGSLSEVFESGNRGPGTVSTGSNDPGGVSYGIYQLSSTAGTLTAFMKAEGSKWASEFGTATGGGSQFTGTWKAVAAREPDAFRDAQHAFIERTHYRRAVAAVLENKGLDLDSRHDAVRDATWSVSVQHGRAAEILGTAVDTADKAGGRGDPGYDRRLAEAIYKARTAYVLKVAANPKLKAGERDQLVSITKNRYPSELAACLKMFG